MEDTARANRSLATDVQFLRGVGPDRAPLLQRLGLATARDLMFFFPRDYEDLSEFQTIDQLVDGMVASVSGIVEETDSHTSFSGTHRFGALIKQDNDYLRAIWFNQPSMRHRVLRGQHVVVSGKVKLAGFRWEMSHPRIKTIGEGPPDKGEILPVYSLTEGLKQSQVRRIVRQVLDTYLSELEEVFPAEFLDRHGLWPIHAALPQIHFPNDHDSLAQARRRFIFQELLVLQLAVHMRRNIGRGRFQAPALTCTEAIDTRIRRLLHFDLTAGQESAIREITDDMNRSIPMNRLLQGDVGSGKTVVAIYTILLTIAHGRQAILMAPTEVLARQHFRTFSQLLSQASVRLELMIGAISTKSRERILHDVAEGTVNMVVGTHALLQEHAAFQNVGLVVIDEQHKFGVRQRARLRQAGEGPHYLVMTATPIPRTVSMTVFGDLDVSTIRDAPPGRQSVHTYLADETKRESWWDFYRRKLREGRQGYVVTPLVDPSDRLELRSVEEAFEALCNGPLEEFRLDLVHGRLSSSDKARAMDQFHAGQTQVLVATSVVEVGVDVANANLMTIENGERFGLTQLHQLRGRIRRGHYPAYVCVFTDRASDSALQRLRVFEETADGFELAEADFNLRGPGDLFGTKQHGLPPLRVADLMRDRELLEEARQAASELVEADPQLQQPEYSLLRKMVLRRYGKALELGDVG